MALRSAAWRSTQRRESRRPDQLGALAVVNGQDQATISDAALSVAGSPYAITAVYGGDSNNQIGTSSTESVTVTQTATTTAVTPGTLTVASGQSATFTASVASSSGAPPDGSVQFLVGGVAYGSAVSLSGGTAQLAISEPAGTYTITAQYTGDANYAATLPAAETGASLTVAAVSAAYNLAISPNTGISSGITDTGAVTLTGTVSTAGAAVDVFDTTTGQDLGIATVSGTSLSLALNLAQGSHVLRVRSSLDGEYADAFFTVLVDETRPTSYVVNNLGTTQTSDSFPVSVSFTDPAGSGGATPSGVSSVSLYVSVNNGAFSLYQTLSVSPPSASGTTTFTFVGQDRNLYAFHSVTVDAAGNTESKSSTAIEASTSVPDLHPPVTHVLASNPSYSWSPYSASLFSGLPVSSYSNGVFTINWAGADPDQNTGIPPGSIAVVDIYAQVDGGTPVLIGQPAGGTPNLSGVYSGSLTYAALGDGLSHTYSFYSVGVDDEQKAQYAPAAGPSSPDVTFSNITYTAPLAVQSFAVEKTIAERSFIEYLDVYFNQTASVPGSVLQQLAAGLTGSNPGSFVELLWYGENLTSSSTPAGSVNLFSTGTTAQVSLSSNDLSINFGSGGITTLLTETGVSGTGNPTLPFGDGWYALGIDPTGNPANGQVFWLTFFRLLGDTNGDGVVTGPYTTAGTDAYTVYHAEGETGPLLDADVNGDGSVNSKDLTETAAAKGHEVGSVPPQSFPQFQLLAGEPSAPPRSIAGAGAITQRQVQSLLPAAITGWQAAGASPADVRLLENVRIVVGNLGTSILGMEASGEIIINQTAAGTSWYVGAGQGTSAAFGLMGPGGEELAAPGSPAAGKVDLLTVLEHELGHVIGLADNTRDGDLMDITLGLGVRRLPVPSDLAAMAGASSTSATVSAAGPSVPAATNDPRRRRLSKNQPAPLAAVDAALVHVASAGGGDDEGPLPTDLAPLPVDGRLGSGGVALRVKTANPAPAVPSPRRLPASLFRRANGRLRVLSAFRFNPLAGEEDE